MWNWSWLVFKTCGLLKSDNSNRHFYDTHICIQRIFVSKKHGMMMHYICKVYEWEKCMNVKYHFVSSDKKKSKSNFSTFVNLLFYDFCYYARRCTRNRTWQEEGLSKKEFWCFFFFFKIDRYLCASHMVCIRKNNKKVLTIFKCLCNMKHLDLFSVSSNEKPKIRKRNESVTKFLEI